MTGEEEKKKPLLKFNPNFKKKNGLSNGKLDSPLETMEALKKNLEDRTRYNIYCKDANINVRHYGNTGCGVFKGGKPKLERFLAKNQL